jgi:RNA methyltransferase, TrmH family
MLSKNRIKYLKSLWLKKNRDAEGIFIAEGPRLVSDLVNFFEPIEILVEEQYLHLFRSFSPTIAGIDELGNVSLMKSPQGVFALFRRRENDFTLVDPHKNPVLALDGVQDPGNLGTIIRTADWFGIEHILCSMDTVDVYNPKVVQATMGAIGRVSVHYTDLESYLSGCNCNVYGAFLEGDSIYSTALDGTGILVMGNEGNGISKAIEAQVTRKIHIPSYPQGNKTSESLNVSTATAIICAEMRRRG